jgi:hypothetical protein
MKLNICVCLDEKTKSLLDNYGEKHSISRSAAMRFIVNSFFIREEGNNETL